MPELLLPRRHNQRAQEPPWPAQLDVRLAPSLRLLIVILCRLRCPGSHPIRLRCPRGASLARVVRPRCIGDRCVLYLLNLQGEAPTLRRRRSAFGLRSSVPTRQPRLRELFESFGRRPHRLLISDQDVNYLRLQNLVALGLADRPVAETWAAEEAGARGIVATSHR